MPDGGSGVVCNALGPVKLSFASTVPVVPSRMATAGTVSTGSYPYAFSWRIFGITSGDQQLAFTDGANGNRVLGYSGALAAADVTLFGRSGPDGRPSDQADSDVFLRIDGSGCRPVFGRSGDYRQIIYNTQYVYCPDAGTDAVVDGISGGSRDVATSIDLQPRPTPDADFSFDLEPAADARVSPVMGFDAQPAPSARCRTQPRHSRSSGRRRSHQLGHSFSDGPRRRNQARCAARSGKRRCGRQLRRRGHRWAFCQGQWLLDGGWLDLRRLPRSHLARAGGRCPASQAAIAQASGCRFAAILCRESSPEPQVTGR